MMHDLPKFAVIGRVNKGKSSIVSTLAEDDTVIIDRGAGTTRACREFPVRIDDTVLLLLIDTPGFQQAPRALAWMKEHEVSAANRREVVADFVREFGHTDEFADECRLLQPILEGAGILYVVDGAKPFRRNYEAEMEILRWTGQPRMALINHIGEGDFSKEWMPALDQYFSIVRHFDAHRVSFADRVRLLQSFRELHDGWRANLDQAIESLQTEWQRRQREAAHIIARMLVDQLTFSKELVLARYETPDDHKFKLEREFHNALRERERKARQQIEKLYHHSKLETDEQDLEKPVFEQDLFAESTWNLLGLNPKQLIGLGAITGATVGGMIDLAVGGASFLAGTVLGGAIGAGSAIFYSAQRLATIENIMKYVQGAQVLRIGPHRNKNFPWVLLDRALLHYISIRDLAHSRRERLHLTENQEKTGLVSRLDHELRKQLARQFEEIRKKTGDDTSKELTRLSKLLLQVVKEI
ncbi:MAG: GTPase and DUF3482 domain-containing protein [Deferribacteres bacterium]|nr:GTPase and DUF3482 domain-containing protein [Deferribacteres bacterium]